MNGTNNLHFCVTSSSVNMFKTSLKHITGGRVSHRLALEGNLVKSWFV